MFGSCHPARRVSSSETALHLAVERGGRALGACALLLTVMEREGGDGAQFVDARDMGGSSALARACRDGHASIARCLLEAQADPAIEDNQQRTAVSHAVANGHHEILALLLGPGPGKSWRASAATVLHLADSKSGATPLQLAAARGDSATQSIVDHARLAHARASAQVCGGGMSRRGG
eukprot:COSAG01_NODE_7466_length_3199_cov_3.514839_1_plen_177_part_10